MLKTNLKKIKKKSEEIKKNIESRKPLFSITDDKLDVIINKPIKGQWKGFKFSELRDDYEGRRVLMWVLHADFDVNIKRLAEEMLA